MSTLEKMALEELSTLIERTKSRIRPEYSNNILEWNTYWNQFILSKEEGIELYNNLKDSTILTLDENKDLIVKIKSLNNSIQILDGIEAFDDSYGYRISPKGLEKTINDQSITGSGGNRLRVYYDEVYDDIYWLLSTKLQGQSYFSGTSGIGMKTGLLNVMKSEMAYKLESGSKRIDLLDKDGNKKSDSSLEGEGASLAIAWVGNMFGSYSAMVGKIESFNIIGRTSDGTEFKRSYTFYFIDGKENIFDPAKYYKVIDGEIMTE